MGLPEPKAREGPMSPERSEGYRREAAPRMPKAYGHDLAKQDRGTIAMGLPAAIMKMKVV